MAIDLDIDVGDVVLGGKFKNHRIIVKKIGRDKELNQPTINDKPLLKFRIEKDMPADKQSKKTREQQKESRTMKLTKTQLKKFLKEALLYKDSDNVSEIEADVWGGNSPRHDHKFVVVRLPKHEVENMTTEGLEQLCIEKFYEKGGFGDDPFCNSLTVDGRDVQEYKDQMHLYEEELGEALRTSNIKKKHVIPSVRNKILELMVSHMLYHHDHGTHLSYWNEGELLADLESELQINEQDWLEQAQQNNPQAITDLFNQAMSMAQQEIDAAWDDNSLDEVNELPTEELKRNVVYEVTLASPDGYVEFVGPDGLSDDDILAKAIQELTENTYVYRLRKVPTGF